MKICISTLFFMYLLGSPALINIFTFVAKCVTTCFLRSFCGRYLVDKMLCGRYLVDILGFFWWSIFDKTPLASLHWAFHCNFFSPPLVVFDGKVVNDLVIFFKNLISEECKRRMPAQMDKFDGVLLSIAQVWIDRLPWCWTYCPGVWWGRPGDAGRHLQLPCS